MLHDKLFCYARSKKLIELWTAQLQSSHRFIELQWKLKNDLKYQ